MTHSSRWLFTLHVSAVACCFVFKVSAQDDLDALLNPAPIPQPVQQPAVQAPEVAEPAPVAVAAPVVVAAPAQPVAEPEPEVEVEEADDQEVVADVAAAVEDLGPKVVTLDDADYEALISELTTLETLRRRSMDDHGIKSLEEAERLMRDGEYEESRKMFKQALDFIVDRPANEPIKKQISDGLAESFYREARLLLKQKEPEKALPLATQAHDLGHPLAERLVNRLKKPVAKDAVDVSSISHRINDDEYKLEREMIRRRLRRSRQYYMTAEYERALEECELVLSKFPEDVEALQLREQIGLRQQSVVDVEFEANRSLMIKDVRKAWTPDRYAIESSQRDDLSRTDLGTKEPVKDIGLGKSDEQIISKKLRDIVIPEVTFRPPATIIDAVDFFKQASRDHDNPEVPFEQRGVNLVLKLKGGGAQQAPPADEMDIFSAAAAAPAASSGVPVIPALSARFINLWDALKLVCDVTGMKFRIRGNIVMIVPTDDPDDQLITRSYNVLPSLTDRLGTASSELGTSGGGGGFGDSALTTSNMDNRQDWKDFFQKMGVVWPEGSAISYIGTIGKLRVTNTAEQLAIFEQILEDLNVMPRLIEIEARFVEVAQNDLNSLGFEWLLNGDFSFNAGGFLNRALGLRKHGNQSAQLTDAAGNLLFDAAGDPLMGFGQYTKPGSASGSGFIKAPDGSLVPAVIGPGQYGSTLARSHTMGVAGIDGESYSTGLRYLNSQGNPIIGEGEIINDQFMRVNAFLGNADLSMILHMLSQRSDTDLLSAPKVVTISGQEAVMKVVTEYIYPTEFEVQISQQGSYGGGSGTSYGSTGEPLAMVEPQNFEMREVGVILQVVPEVQAEGQMINLLLNPQVVSEPVWKNYGTKIPKMVPRPATTAELAMNPLQTVVMETIYTELPMEQPFFHVRSVQTQLSVYNGATVVMGGLITEARKTIEDKIPFLGDLPFLGRLFRSRSEQSEKRNLLVFVTARLVDPAGRAVRMSSGDSALISGGDVPSASVAPVLMDGDDVIN